nr:hypothetical protein CFP56_62383 [Quercus suber]
MDHLASTKQADKRGGQYAEPLLLVQHAMEQCSLMINPQASLLSSETIKMSNSLLYVQKGGAVQDREEVEVLTAKTAKTAKRAIEFAITVCIINFYL